MRNLTSGFDMDRGFEYIAQPSLSNMVPWMSWSPVGDRLAYFVRNEKYKTLIIQNVLTGKIEQRFRIADASTIRNRRTSRPTAARCSSAACAARPATSSGSTSSQRRHHEPHQRRVRGLRARLLARRPLHRLHGAHQRIAEAVPARSRHGKKTQLTFGTQDEAAAKFLERRHDHLLVDRDRSGDAADARSGAQRQHLQPVVAQPEERRAQAVHRRARRRALAGRAVEGRRRRRSWRSSTTTRAATACTRSISRSRCIPPRRPTSARPGRSSTSRRRCSTRSSPRTSRRRAGSTRCSSTAGRR